MNPILIASPVRRCGTTLLQRLLCSSSNCLIYGESCANDIIMTTNMMVTKEMQFASSQNWRNQQLEQVLHGEVNHWIPDLMPEMSGYLDNFRSSMNSIITHYPDFAALHGRSFWGAKLPEWNVHHLVQLNQKFPGIKIIYLNRQLAACLRSAKAMGMVQNQEDARFFCQLWKHNSEFVQHNLKGENILHLQYENLVNDPEECVNQIAKFTGAKDMKVSIFEHKVNDYSDPERDEEMNYIQPEKLEDEDWELVRKYGSEL